MSGMSGTPLYEPFVPEDYAAVLAHFTETSVEDVWDGRESHWTFLRKADGTPIQFESILHAPVAPGARRR
jgi:hypothetical protein